MPRLKAFTAQYANRDFSTAVRAAMAAEKCTAKELSDATDLSAQTLRQRLESPQSLTVDNVRKIAERLSLPDEIVCRFVLAGNGG